MSAPTLVWYFAFGANMAPSVFLDRRRMRPISSEAAVLRAHRITFDLRGVPLVEPAFASVRDDPEGHVEGVLYRLPARDLARLRRHESPRYACVEVDVEGARSGAVRATIFRNVRPVDGLIPSRRYVDLLLEGARAHALSEAWIAALRAQPTVYVPLVSPAIAGVIGALDHALKLGRAAWRRDR